MSVNREELKRERQVLDHIQQASITSMDFWDNPNYKQVICCSPYFHRVL